MAHVQIIMIWLCTCINTLVNAILLQPSVTRQPPVTRSAQSQKRGPPITRSETARLERHGLNLVRRAAVHKRNDDLVYKKTNQFQFADDAHSDDDTRLVDAEDEDEMHKSTARTSFWQAISSKFSSRNVEEFQPVDCCVCFETITKSQDVYPWPKQC